MRNLNGCRVVLLLAPAVFLLFPVAVLVFVLERISKSLLLEHTYRSYRTGAYIITLNGPNSTNSNASTDVNVTMDIDQAPTFAMLGVCVAAYIVCAIDAFGIWELKKVEGTSGHQRMWAWVATISNVIMAAISLGVFGWASGLQSSNQGWQGYDDVQKSDREYTRETWSCQIERFYPNEGWASAACGTAVSFCSVGLAAGVLTSMQKATRFLLIPMAIFSLIVLVSLWILVRQRGGFKWLCGGKGRYAGFDNVYELQQGGPPAPYVQAPPQWTPQPYYVVRPAQQWAPQAVPYGQKTDVTTDERAVFR